MSKIIMVTGGRGFIGVNLCNRLAKEGNQVIAVDNMCCPSPMNPHKNVNIYMMSVSNWYFRDQVLKAYPKVDEIYHLASMASPVWYKQSPLRTIRTNVVGTMAVCDIAEEYGARLLFTSTSEVYGNPEQHPQKETYNGNVNTLSPRACYDESKRCAETIVWEYGKKISSINAIIVRLFNTYGPGMRVDDGRVVSEFICRMIQGRPLTLYNAGIQTRSFCYIDDMVEWLIRAMAAKAFGPFNIGNNQEITIAELSLRIADYFNIYLPNTNTPVTDINDPPRRCPDLKRARVVLGYEPKVSLKDGLELTIEYFKKLLNK